MDYGHSELNSLTSGFGKYDIAALRFGYAREVELKDGSFAKVESSLTETEKVLGEGKAVKNFGFCTDENAGGSIRCNRFDEGSSATEIAQFHERQYHDNYKYRNFRNGRADFTEWGTAQAISSRNSMFKAARAIYEEYEFYESIFGQDVMEAGCSPEELAKYPICKEINDKHDAIKLVGKFFLDILKTPDLSCALAKKESADKLEKVVTLASLYNDSLKYELTYVPSSCFDPNVKAAFEKDGLIVVAQAGRFFNSVKENNPLYNNESDIAVRGIWIDKLLAMKMLTLRYFGLGMTEDLQGALADVTEIKEELLDYISHITLGTELANPLPFQTEAGEEVLVPYAIDSSYVIPEQASEQVSRYFGLGVINNTKLNQQELKMAARFIQTADLARKDAADAFLKHIGVYKKGITTPFEKTDLQILKHKDYYYAANNENTIAQTMISTAQAKDILGSLNKELITKVLKAKKGIFTIPATFTEKEIMATKVPVSLLGQLLELTRKGVKITEERFITLLGEEMGKNAFAAFGLGEAGLTKIINFIDKEQSAPAGAGSKVKFLYSLDASVLEKFLSNTLDDTIARYLEGIEILPSLSL